ncbi:MAG: hypothetical protein KDK37_17795 [Leptospiraceae bacterium]|nr:hypothetical protein [Leptospiraceae bacterium]MCB1306148.1 hypothetical protein [Leptospiraceae bacterium]
MTIGGWIVMTLSVGFVTVLFGSTLYLILRQRPESTEHMHSTMEETPDMHDET